MTAPRVTYRRSPVTEWTAPAFRKLTADAKLVLLAARLGPSSNMIGLCFCPATLLAAFTGLPLDRVLVAEGELTPAFLERDPETDEVLVVGAVEAQVGETLKDGDRRLPHIAGLLRGTHSPRLLRRWAELHRQIAPKLAAAIVPLEGASDAPSEGASEGAPHAPSKPVAVAVAVSGAVAGAGAGAAAGTAPSACAVAGTGETHAQPSDPTAHPPIAAPPALARAAQVAAAAVQPLSEDVLTGWRNLLKPPTHAGTLPATP
jgi:hypothetical protein